MPPADTKRRRKLWLCAIAMLVLVSVVALYISVQHNDPAVAELRNFSMSSEFQRVSVISAMSLETRTTGVSETLYFSLEPMEVVRHVARLFGERAKRSNDYDFASVFEMKDDDDVGLVNCVQYAGSDAPKGAKCVVIVHYRANWFDDLMARRQ